MSEFNSGPCANEAQTFAANFDPAAAAHYAERLSLEPASAGQIAEFFQRVNGLVELGSRQTQSFRIGSDSFMTVIPYEQGYQVIICRFDLNPNEPQSEFYRLDLAPNYLTETVETGQLEFCVPPALNPDDEYADPDFGFWSPVEEWLTLPTQTTKALLSDLDNTQPLEDCPAWVPSEMLNGKYLQFAKAILGCYFTQHPDGSYIRNDKDASGLNGLGGIRLPEQVGDAKELCLFCGWMEAGDE